MMLNTPVFLRLQTPYNEVNLYLLFISDRIITTPPFPLYQSRFLHMPYYNMQAVPPLFFAVKAFMHGHLCHLTSARIILRYVRHTRPLFVMSKDERTINLNQLL